MVRKHVDMRLAEDAHMSEENIVEHRGILRFLDILPINWHLLSYPRLGELLLINQQILP